MWETREFLLQKKLNTSVISINAVHSFVPQVMWNREGWWSSGYHMKTVATKRFVWSERKVVNKHSKWSSEGGNKVVCVEQTNNYYAPEPQTTVCGKIPLSMRYASLALRTLTCSTLVSHQQSSHYWLIREDQFGPMLLKYLLPMYFLYCSILLKEL